MEMCGAGRSSPGSACPPLKAGKGGSSFLGLMHEEEPGDGSMGAAQVT
jgi:hypothetical protein